MTAYFEALARAYVEATLDLLSIVYETPRRIERKA